MGLLLVLGFVWALPVSLAGLLVALCGGVRLHRREGLVWHFVAVPKGLLSRHFFTPMGVAAFTWGAVQVYADGRLLGVRHLVTHETRHTHQAFLFGPLMPVVYGLGALWGWARHGKAYHANPLEADARRAAGEE